MKIEKAKMAKVLKFICFYSYMDTTRIAYKTASSSYEGAILPNYPNQARIRPDFVRACIDLELDLDGQTDERPRKTLKTS